MICDLCDKDQQNICERTHHFIKPINECLIRKAQENRQIIEELESIKAEIVELEKKMGQGIFTVELASEIVNDHIAELKGE